MDALEKIKERMEAIRKESYDKGYADAIRAMEKLFGASTPSSQKAPKGRLIDPDKAPTITVPRGMTRKLVTEAFAKSGGKALSPVEIQHSILKETGTSLASTSVRRAIEYYDGGGRVKRVPGTTTWRWIG
jgi:hypothetical protein